MQWFHSGIETWKSSFLSLFEIQPIWIGSLLKYVFRFEIDCFSSQSVFLYLDELRQADAEKSPDPTAAEFRARRVKTFSFFFFQKSLLLVDMAKHGVSCMFHGLNDA